MTTTPARPPRLPTNHDVAGRVAPVDATWLRLDTDDNLVTVTAVLWTSTPLDRDRFEGVLRDRLLVRFPRFATRAVRTPRGAVWEPVDVDLRHHVVDAVLPEPGGQAALEGLCGALMGVPLDPERPAWQFHLVREYGSGSAVVARLHHSLADGIALARVLLAMSDGAPDGTLGAPQGTGPEPGRGAGLHRAGRGARLAAATALTLARIALLPGDPPSVFRGPLGVAKRAAWAEPVTVAEAKALARACGGTVNDVVTAAVAGGLRRYAVERGRPPGDLRAFVPVDLRRGAPVPPGLGNRFGLLLLPLPVGAVDRGVRLRRVRRTLDTLKAGPMAAATHATLGLLGLGPAALQRLALRFLGARGTAVLTNLPGPREPVRLAGAELAGVVPWVPQAAGVALGLSVFSYAGRVVLGVAGDERVVGDPRAVLEAIVAELDALRDLLTPEPSGTG